MFAEYIEVELVDLNTGAVTALKARPMTLSMKNNLDEWLRYRFMKFSQREWDDLKGAERAEAMSIQEELASRLDVFLNNWFLPETDYLPRVLWEIAAPGISYNEFIRKFFQIKMKAFHEVGEEKDRFAANMNAVKEAVEFTLRNPTQTTTEEVRKAENPAS